MKSRLLAILLACPRAWASPVEFLPGQHLTDGQDRLMSGALAPMLEKKSRAAALYADGLIAFDGHAADAGRAVDELRQAAALDPHNEDAQIKLANVLLQTGQVEEAYDQLSAAAARHPGTYDSLLGYTQHLRGQDDEAVRLSTHALNRNPDDAASMRVLLEVAAGQNDLSGAVLHIEDILRGGPSVAASAWLTLGRLYLEIARDGTHPLPGDLILRTLLPIYHEATEKAPPDVGRLTLLSEAYQDLGRGSEALQCLRRAAALEPENVDVRLRCARLEMALDQSTAALKDYEAAYRLNPDLSGLREMLGRLYLEQEKFAEAARLLDEALKDSPTNPDLESDLGLAAYGRHDEAGAAVWFKQAFGSAQCTPEDYLKLAAYQINHDEIKKAADTLALARARFPQSARVLFYQAVQNRCAKNYAAALACLDAMRPYTSSQGDAFDPSYYLESALILSLAHAEARIEPILREGLGKYPDNPALMNELAFTWAEAGTHLDQALALARQAVRLDPQNGAIVDTLGWVYFKAGKVNEALPYLQRAAVMTKNDPVVLQHVGDAWLKLDHAHEAVTAWRFALRKDPGNPALTTRITAALAQANHAHPRSAPTK